MTTAEKTVSFAQHGFVSKQTYVTNFDRKLYCVGPNVFRNTSTWILVDVMTGSPVEFLSSGLSYNSDPIKATVNPGAVEKITDILLYEHPLKMHLDPDA